MKNLKRTFALSMAVLTVGSVSAFANPFAMQGAEGMEGTRPQQMEGMQKMQPMNGDFEFVERVELTDEEKEAMMAERIAQATALLEEKVATGEITQEQADALAEKLTSADFQAQGQKGGKVEFATERTEKGEKVELSDEEKEAMMAERIAQATALLEEKVATGEITQEQADALAEKLTSADFQAQGQKGGKAEFATERAEKGEKVELSDEEKEAMKAEREAMKADKEAFAGERGERAEFDGEAFQGQRAMMQQKGGMMPQTAV